MMRGAMLPGWLCVLYVCVSVYVVLLGMFLCKRVFVW